jgi:hypothetical protein
MIHDIVFFGFGGLFVLLVIYLLVFLKRNRLLIFRKRMTWSHDHDLQKPPNDLY